MSCSVCDGSKHVLQEDGSAKRCPECFPTEKEPVVVGIPVRFQDLRLASIRDEFRGNPPEYFRIANTVALKAISGERLKAFPVFTGSDDNIFKLASAVCNDVSAKRGCRCAMTTMSQLQDVYFNDKRAGFYSLCTSAYRVVCIYIGTDIATSASAKILKEILLERKNRGQYTILMTDVPLHKLAEEGYPPDIRQILNDKTKTLAVAISNGR